MKHIFLDTNIFLHFQYFEQIDWLSECASNQCKLLISPVVMDELDKKKIGTSKIGSKARKALTRFEELYEIRNPEIKENIFFEIIHQKPARSIYKENGLNFEEQDQRLLASIIAYLAGKSVKDVLLCTDDTGLRLRARELGISPLKLDAKYCLPSEQSEVEKKLKKLERENQILKSAVPQIDVEFENSKKFIELKINKEKAIVFEEFRSSKMKEIMKKYPAIEIPDKSLRNKRSSKDSQSIATKLAVIMAEEAGRQDIAYNERLNDFYEEYEKWLTEFYELERLKRLTYEIRIFLVNSGFVPAEDIDIHLHFPDGFVLVETSELPSVGNGPEPPSKSNSMSGLSIPTNFNMPQVNSFDPAPIPSFNRPTIEKTNSYNVNFRRNGLKHGYSQTLDSLSIVFNHENDIKNFQIEYELSAANMPEMEKGELYVKFTS